MNRSVRALLVTTCCALAACDAAARPAVTVTDSAGVRLTLSRDAPLRFAVVDAAPTLSLGGAEEAGPTQFHRIQNVLVDRRDRLWVADGGSGELRIFHPDGTPWKTRGGEGEGPGEFMRIRLLGAYTGDSVLVADDATGRLTVFDPEGEVVRSLSESMVDGPWPRMFDAFADGTVLGQVPKILAAAALRPNQLLVAAGPLWIWTGRAQVPMPFTANAGFDVVGETVHLVSGPAFRVRVFDGGRLAAVYGVDRPARRVTDADMAAYRAFAEEYIPEPTRAAYLAALRHEALPSLLPAYRSVTCATDGHVWAELYEADPSAAPAWDVYDAQGRFVGRADGPAGLAVDAITADVLVGVWRDDVGVERVRSYRYTPLGAAASDQAAPPSLRSWVVGTAALSVLLLVAAALTALRPLSPRSGRGRRRLIVLGIVAVGLQTTHAAEEYRTGFYEAFPRMLGLQPWGSRAFLAFNLAWLLVWALSLVGVSRGWRIAEWPIWFLALALIANGLAHPLLSLARREYFPGLGTAPVVGIAGLLLLREMLLASARARPSVAGAR